MNVGAVPAVASCSRRDRSEGQFLDGSASNACAPVSAPNRYLEAFDQGRTERRRIQARGFEFIGKEADRYEEVFLVDAGSELPIRYGSPQPSTVDLQAALAAASVKFGDAAVGRAIGLPRSTIAKLKSGKTKLVRGQPPGIAERLRELQVLEDEFPSRETKVIEGYREAIRQHGGLRAAAKALGLDASNLSRRLRRHPGGRP